MANLAVNIFPSPITAVEALGCALGGLLATFICYHQRISIPRGAFTWIYDVYRRYKFLLSGALMISEAYKKVGLHLEEHS